MPVKCRPVALAAPTAVLMETEVAFTTPVMSTPPAMVVDPPTRMPCALAATRPPTEVVSATRG